MYCRCEVSIILPADLKHIPSTFAKFPEFLTTSLIVSSPSLMAHISVFVLSRTSLELNVASGPPMTIRDCGCSRFASSAIHLAHGYWVEYALMPIISQRDFRRHSITSSRV